MSGFTRARPWHDSPAGYALRAATSAALVIGAVVHFQDAHFYDANTGSLLDQGQLFRIQGVAAILVAVLVLVWPRWQSWLLAFLVAVSACAAVVTYNYVDVGPILGLPNMYEPSWGPPGKVVSAWAEGIGALLALTGLIRALAHRRAARRQRGATTRLATPQHSPSR
jgi:glucan phosphoethanolaminetransferase (alkaline phosphatase superfamily)